MGGKEQRMTRQEKGMWDSDREFGKGGETNRAGGVATDQGKTIQKSLTASGHGWGKWE